MSKTSKGERTRERLHQATREMIAKEGLSTITMRSLAHHAGLSPSAAYHYINSKDELVLSLFTQTQTLIDLHAVEIAAQGGSLKTRLESMFIDGLDILYPQREVLGHLAAAILTPKSSLSPFSSSTRGIRNKAIGSFKVAIGDHKDCDALAELCWFAWLPLILFWLHDRSTNQQATKSLIKQCLPITVRALPFIGGRLFSIGRLVHDALLEPQDLPPEAH